VGGGCAGARPTAPIPTAPAVCEGGGATVAAVAVSDAMGSGDGGDVRLVQAATARVLEASAPKSEIGRSLR
jgi:hypothetical protein